MGPNMGRNRTFRVVVAGWLLAASYAAGCGGAEAPTVATAGHAGGEVGTVSLPLVTETGGHRYRLHNAFIYVSGPPYLQLASSDDPAETALSAMLPTGSYYANLYNWTLERDDGAGHFRPVQASLLPPSVATFSILNGATTTLRFRFSTDGVIVEVGAGELRVDVTVDEIPPVCMPFAAEDGCAPGSWCPPSGLTALPRACMSAGTIELGLPCLGALDCVAGAACTGGDGGPVCTALCPSADVGTACATGGTCLAVKADYGVCAP
jgi:hypothetical protein